MRIRMHQTSLRPPSPADDNRRPSRRCSAEHIRAGQLPRQEPRTVVHRVAVPTVWSRAVAKHGKCCAGEFAIADAGSGVDCFCGFFVVIAVVPPLVFGNQPTLGVLNILSRCIACRGRGCLQFQRPRWAPCGGASATVASGRPAPSRSAGVGRAGVVEVRQRSGSDPGVPIPVADIHHGGRRGMSEVRLVRSEATPRRPGQTGEPAPIELLRGVPAVVAGCVWLRGGRLWRGGPPTGGERGRGGSSVGCSRRVPGCRVSDCRVFGGGSSGAGTSGRGAGLRCRVGGVVGTRCGAAGWGGSECGWAAVVVGWWVGLGGVAVGVDVKYGAMRGL